MIKERISITLDTDNIPKDYFQVECDSSYFMTYSQMYMENVGIGGQTQAGQSEEEEGGDYVDGLEKESLIEELFRVNKETLEREYNLTTLNLEKISMVNFKGAMMRPNKEIRDEDVVFPTDGTFLLKVRRYELRSWKKRLVEKNFRRRHEDDAI